MKQYYSIKAKHPDAVLLFRVGDFYETFGDDAIRAAEILGITLTRRANGAASFVELAGFPYHALDTYLPKLVRAGQRVAICEQLEDPKQTKTIVKRGITELVTPGVSFNENVLDNRENNFLASIYLENKSAGVSFLDISTGEFLTAQGSFEYVDKLLSSFQPRELLVEKRKQKEVIDIFGSTYYTFPLDDWVYTEDNAHDKLTRQFQTNTLKGFGVEALKLGIIASGAILQYLDLTQHTNVNHILTLSRIEEDHFVWLDRFTIRNLEIFRSIYDEGKTLVDILDITVSPMGSRMLKRWLALPLKDIVPLNERLDIVEYFKNNNEARLFFRDRIKAAGDLERIISKVAVNRVSPREMLQLSTALGIIGPLKERCSQASPDSLKRIGEHHALDAAEKHIGRYDHAKGQQRDIIRNAKPAFQKARHADHHSRGVYRHEYEDDQPDEFLYESALKAFAQKFGKRVGV